MKLKQNKQLNAKLFAKAPLIKQWGYYFRLPPERKDGKPFDIVQGQTLTVGSDISEETADQLLDSKSWKFEEVTK